MEKKESTVIGVPFVVLFFIFALAILIDGFNWFFIYQPLRNEIQTDTAVQRIPVPMSVSPTVTPTATPSATVAPVTRTLVAPKTVVTPSSVK